MKTNEIFLHFHIGRGGRFYNAGHTEFFGCDDLQRVIRMQADNLYERNRDKNGRFCKKVLVDCNGSVVCETPDAKTGKLDFDGTYDTDVVLTLQDVEEFSEYGETKWADILYDKMKENPLNFDWDCRDDIREWLEAHDYTFDE